MLHGMIFPSTDLWKRQCNGLCVTDAFFIWRQPIAIAFQSDWREAINLLD